jgi:hypothetical protein
MARTVQTRVGDVELLLETTAVAGSEPTSRLSDAVAGLEDAFARAQHAIVEIAASTAQVISAAGKRGARPDSLEVQFGLKVSAQGNVIVAGTAGEATLQVKLTYSAAQR